MHRLSVVTFPVAVVLLAFSSVETDSAAAQESPGNADHIVDLTHPFDADTIYWPTERGFELMRGEAGYTNRGYYYAANRFRAAEHGGTHLDAPIHFFEGRNTVDQIPLERLMGPGVVVDVSAKCTADADYQITVDDLRAWEAEHERELNDVIVLLRTGWSRHWPDRAKYLGTEDRGDEAVAKLHFPGLHPSAAGWLVERRSVKAVGIDTAQGSTAPLRRRRAHFHLSRTAHRAWRRNTAARIRRERLRPQQRRRESHHRRHPR
jgi:kynurenine formamidase